MISLTKIAHWISAKAASWRSMFARGDDDLGGGGGSKLTRAYANSVWVRQAIQAVSGPIKKAEIRFTDLKGQPVKDDSQTAFWNKPAKSKGGLMSRTEFIDATVIWMNMSGQAFWVLDDSWLVSSMTKSPIILARPCDMEPIKDHADELKGWWFRDARGSRYLLTPQQVVRPRFSNPYDDIEGLAPWQAARIAAESDYAAGLFGKNVMESNGDRGVYVIAKSGVLDDAQRQQIISQLRQKQELSRRGIFKPAFLTGDISVEDPKVASTDGQFMAQRMGNRHEIFIAFGVPASMAEVTASYSVGSASDRYRLLEETCIPLAGLIAEAVEHVESLRRGEATLAEFDFSEHSTMRAVRAENVGNLEKLFKMGMPVKQASTWLGLDMPPYPGWQKGFLPMALQEVRSKGEGDGEDNDDDEKETETPEISEEQDATAAGKAALASMDALTRLFEQRVKGGTEASADPCGRAASQCRCGHPEWHEGASCGSNEKALTPEQLALWKKHMAMRAPSVKAIRTQFNKALIEARTETLRRLETTKAIAAVRTRGVLEIIFDLETFELRVVQLVNPALTEALHDAAEQFSEELGLDDPWKVEDPEVARFLGTRESRLKDASKEVWEDVRDVLQEGIDSGESNDELAKRVREKFNGISKTRAETIAQTETACAYGHARQKGMEETGIEWKEWLTAGDDKVRAEHVRANEQQRRVDEAFDIAGEQLMHPGDPNGSAKNVINCRCVVIPIREPKQEE
jgi:SPP1 gp7 family putative phage head morphogenesis protein